MFCEMWTLPRQRLQSGQLVGNMSTVHWQYEQWAPLLIEKDMFQFFFELSQFLEDLLVEWFRKCQNVYFVKKTKRFCSIIAGCNMSCGQVSKLNWTYNQIKLIKSNWIELKIKLNKSNQTKLNLRSNYHSVVHYKCTL